MELRETLSKCTCIEHDPYCCQIHGNCPVCVKPEEPEDVVLGYKTSLVAQTMDSMTNNKQQTMKTYRKTATVQAKLFEQGDENGFIHPEGIGGVITDLKSGFKPELVPYIRTLENPFHIGEFGKHYICVGIKGERWLVEKEIFESTYEEVSNDK
jgi:hypothetical protein